MPSGRHRECLLRLACTLLQEKPIDLFYLALSLELGKYKPTEAQIARGVSLGFCQGNRMSNEDGALLSEGRKQVYVLYIRSLKEMDENQVRALLFEAGMVDEEFKKIKKVKRSIRKRTDR